MPNTFSRPIRTVALIGKYRSHEVAESLLQLAAWLRERDVTVLWEAGTAVSIAVQGFPVVPYDVIGTQADVAIVVGGDGTLLHAARRLADFGVPLVGVNQGRLGFMTDLPREAMLDGMQDLLAGRFQIERRFLLDAEIERGEQRVFHTLALNDVVISKGDSGRMIELRVAVDDEFVYVLRADGMIVATPTGSTAYALAANGPVLHPAVAGIALVPLCPHALSYRPIAIGDACRVELSLVPPHDARVHFDGQARFDARPGDLMRLRRARQDVLLLHPPGYSYFAMLREKLHWSATPKH